MKSKVGIEDKAVQPAENKDQGGLDTPFGSTGERSAQGYSTTEGVWVRFKAGRAVAGVGFAGEIVLVGRAEADYLIGAGYAEAAEAPQAEVENPEGQPEVWMRVRPGRVVAGIGGEGAEAHVSRRVAERFVQIGYADIFQKDEEA